MGSSKGNYVRSKRSVGYIPNFRDTSIKRTLSDIKDDKNEGSSDKLNLTKDMVDKLIDENNKQIHDVKLNKESIQDVSNDERIHRIELKLKN